MKRLVLCSDENLVDQYFKEKDIQIKISILKQMKCEQLRYVYKRIRKNAWPDKELLYIAQYVYNHENDDSLLLDLIRNGTKNAMWTHIRAHSAHTLIEQDVGIAKDLLMELGDCNDVHLILELVTNCDDIDVLLKYSDSPVSHNIKRAARDQLISLGYFENISWLLECAEPDAIADIRDQYILERIAMEGRVSSVRAKAVLQLENLELLKHIMDEDDAGIVVRSAIKRIKELEA